MLRKPDIDVVIEDVCFRYPRPYNSSIDDDILRNVSLDIRSGSIVSVVGHSGCGKSTLLRLIAGLLDARSGRITVAGDSPAVSRRAGHFGFVFQDPNLMAWRTVYENISLPGEVGRKQVNKNDIEQLIHLVGLDGYENYYPANLSGGMRSRVAIARALVTKPGLILMDESFASLDELTRERLSIDFMNLVHLQGATVVFVTHNISEAVFMSDQVNVARGKPATLSEQIHIPLPRPRLPAHRETPEFFGAIRQIKQALGAELQSRP